MFMDLDAAVQGLSCQIKVGLGLKIDDNLFDVIDLENVQCLNEEKTGSCKSIFRPEGRRLEITEDTLLESPDGDPEIILIIP